MNRGVSSSVSNRTLIAYAVCALSYLLKFVLFRLLVGWDGALNGGEIAAAYISTSAIALLLAGVVFWDRRKACSIVLAILLDGWMVANILYMRANRLLIDWTAVCQINQLSGFEDAILSYLDLRLVVFPLLTIGMACVLLSSRQAEGSRSLRLRTWGLSLIPTFLLYVGGEGLSAISYVRNYDTWSFHADTNRYLATHSPLEQLVLVGFEATCEKILHWNAAMPLTDAERQLLNEIYTEPTPAATPTAHLVFILVESWESWSLNAHDRQGRAVSPYLNDYRHTHPVLYCDHVITQQRHGRSGDGQLVTQTGMLPLLHGVACTQYGNQPYPNFAHFYPRSVIISPSRGVWNQQTVTHSYGYQSLIEPSNKRQHYPDSVVLRLTQTAIEEATVPTCILAITHSMHAPFRMGDGGFCWEEGMPIDEQRYLECVHYTDRQIGRFLQWADTAATMRDATIVITADHNHFARGRNRGYCPLIIRSPRITETEFIASAYQMDIFPTILSLIDQQNYAWHGFGRDMRDTLAHRSASLPVYEHLSDKLIRRQELK